MDTVRTRHEYLKQSNQKVVDNRKKRRVRGLYISLAVVVFICIAIVLTLRLMKWKLDTVIVSGNVIVEESAVRDAIRDATSGKILFLVSKSSLPIIQTGKLSQMLETKFPRIEMVTVQKKYPRTISVIMTERKAFALWCGPDRGMLKSADTECYFVDKNGIIFSRAPFISGDVYFTFYTNAPGVLGEVLPKDAFKRAISLKEKLETLHVSPFALLQKNDGIYEMIVHGDSSGIYTSPHIKFRMQDDDLAIQNSLELAFGNLDIPAKNNIDAFEYIDIRFANKIFYKKK